MRVLTYSFLFGLLAAAFAVNAGDNRQGKGHWGYEGHEGPSHWAEISEDFSTCGAGSRQSPIDINMQQSVKANLSDIKFDYQPVSAEVVNNGHTIQVNYPKGSSIIVGGVRYDLLQFHFHTPSENTLAGKPFAMEMHLVHKNSAGELAVVGVFLDQGSKNPVLQNVWNNMPAGAGKTAKLSKKINAADLLPAKQSYAHFNGSLTTPPCSEGVNWFVMKEPVDVSPKQIEKFSGIIGKNARPVQALNNRFVLANQ